MSDTFELRADTITQDPATNQANYDSWSPNYDTDVAAWDYQCPAVAAQILQAYVGRQEPILDAGCGTGLTGLAFHRAGFETIDGLDISPKSVALAAARGVYRDVAQGNLGELPLNRAAGSYGATTCIGVLTYIHEPQSLLREFCRVTKAGGFVIITQRDDIFAELNFGGQLRELERAGLGRTRLISDPQSYLPGHPDYQDDIKVIYIALEVIG